jgi:hypothetical protein
MTDHGTRDDGDHEPAHPDDRYGASALDALSDYSPVYDEVHGGWRSADPLAAQEAAFQDPTALFTVTNPAGTVSATATIGGRLHRVELSANVTRMTEPQLADEIIVLADLAAQKAKAAQHAVVVQLMRAMGHDSVVTSRFLEHDLGLPSPESVTARTAQIFAARYKLQDEA